MELDCTEFSSKSPIFEKLANKGPSLTPQKERGPLFRNFHCDICFRLLRLKAYQFFSLKY